MERFATKIFSATKRCNNVVTIQNNVTTMLQEEEEKQPLVFGLLASGRGRSRFASTDSILRRTELL